MATIGMLVDIIVMRPDYVDLHCHILPGLDDGPKSMASSLKLARQAVNDGVKTILATPHHLDRRFVNHPEVVRKAVLDFQTALKRESISLKVFPGQEIRVNGQLMTNLDDLLGISESQKYLLLELPFETVPGYLEELVFRLLCAGITPVIAHPERNRQIIAEPKILYNLVNMGVLAQVTATSLVGAFGKQVQRTAKEFVRCGLVQVVVSDAHALTNRHFAMTQAYQVLAALDVNYPEWFATNAKDLINGADISVEVIEMPRNKRKFRLF